MQDRAEDDAGVLPAAAALVTERPAAAWRRRRGPLAWVALEHLALSSHLSDQGWVAPMGVRDVASGIGVTKDTAARAVATSAPRVWWSSPTSRARMGKSVPATGSICPNLSSSPLSRW